MRDAKKQNNNHNKTVTKIRGGGGRGALRNSRPSGHPDFFLVDFFCSFCVMHDVLRERVTLGVVKNLDFACLHSGHFDSDNGWR